MKKLNQLNDKSCSICSSEKFIDECSIAHYSYVQCLDCAVVRQYPYPNKEVIKEFYKEYKTHKSETSNYLSEDSYNSYYLNRMHTLDDLNMLNAIEGKSLLDVGCGTGQFVRMIGDIADNVKGIDISEECIELARKNNLNCEIKNFI